MLLPRRLDVELERIVEQHAGELLSVSSPATTTRMSGVIPAPVRCALPRDDASTVMMPTARPGGSIRWTSGTSIRLDVNTGTATACASSVWNRARNPQLVVIAPTPARSRARAPSTKSGEDPLGLRTTRFEDAPRTG